MSAHRYLDGEFDGHGYSYTDHNTRSNWLVDLWDLEDLGRRLEEGESDALSKWCAETHAEELR
jgi:hypothetical protein